MLREKKATELEDIAADLNRLTSDPAALGGLVTDPRNEIADATGFLPSVSRFLAGMSEALGGGRSGGGRGGGALGRFFFILFHV